MDGFSEFVFGKNQKINKSIGLVLMVIFIFAIILNSITPEVEFVDPNMVTPTHYYQTPRPEPNRTVRYFNYHTGEYTYMDDPSPQSSREPTIRSHQPRAPVGSSIEERKALNRLREVYKEEARREFEDLLDEHEIDW